MPYHDRSMIGFGRTPSRKDSALSWGVRHRPPESFAEPMGNIQHPLIDERTKNRVALYP